MFNPNPIIQRVPIGGGAECLVIDNFLSDPQQMVAEAVAGRAAFSANPVNAYPGIEKTMPPEFDRQLEAYFAQHLMQPFNASSPAGLNTRMSIVTLRPGELNPQQRICHRDAHNCPPGEGACAAVLYLFEDPRFGGTSFYRPLVSADEIDFLLHQVKLLDGNAFTKVLGVPPEYFNRANRYFERTATIPAAWNRAIFYDATIFHSGQIDAPELLDADPARGRLTVNAFLRYRKNAS